MIDVFKAWAYNTDKYWTGCLTPGWEGPTAKPVQVRYCPATV